MSSILTTIKNMLGINADDTSFDTDVIVHINSALMNLNQLGIGPAEGYSIADATEEWTDFLETEETNLEGIKSYVYLKVKVMFDLPPHAYVLDALARQITELEWRLNAQAEQGKFLPEPVPEGE